MWLRRHRALWEPRPFAEHHPAWLDELPDVARWLAALDGAQVDAVDGPAEGRAGEDGVPRFPAAAPKLLGALAGEARALCAVGPLEALDEPRDAPHPAARSSAGSARTRFRVPGRKLAQIDAFLAAAAPALGAPGRDRRGAAPVVDWCAGKGHLGRTLAARLGTPVLGVERDPALCEVGAALARRAGVAPEPGADFLVADVHTPQAWAPLAAARGAVALHACGALGEELLRRGSERGTPALALAPCCHHKLAPGVQVRTPLTATARAAGLPLDRGDLRLATADEVVAPGRLRRARRREQALRQGIDLLVREATGVDRYTPLGPLTREELSSSFEVAARSVAGRLGLPLPTRWDPDQAARAGVERARRARGLGLLRAIFRRPLELWVSSDRALFVAERGYDVALGTFCPRRVTPRNLAIVATMR